MYQYRGSRDRLSTWQYLRKWLRIVPRRKFRRMRARFTWWNRTTGQEWRERARETSEKVAARSKEELDELREDSREHYERTKPQLVLWARSVQDFVRRFWRGTVRWTRITASIIVSAALVAGIAFVAYLLLRDTDSSGTGLTCEDCPSFSVTRVIDGDTIDTNAGRIRIYGADTPEIGDACYIEATNEMTRLAGESVRVERGTRLTDQFERHLYYVYTGSGQSIDELLVKNGFAVAWPWDGQHRDYLVGLQESAEASRTGCLWN